MQQTATSPTRTYPALHSRRAYRIPMLASDLLALPNEVLGKLGPDLGCTQQSERNLLVLEELYSCIVRWRCSLEEDEVE